MDAKKLTKELHKDGIDLGNEKLVYLGSWFEGDSVILKAFYDTEYGVIVVRSTDLGKNYANKKIGEFLEFAENKAHIQEDLITNVKDLQKMID